MIKLSPRRAKSSTGATRRSVDTVAVGFQWQALKFVFPLAALLLVSLLSYKGVGWLASMPAGEVMVTGYSGALGSAQGVTPEQIQMQISDDMTMGFWSIDLNRMQERLESIPWVRRANIRRVWPNQLAIGIDEHVVVARWNYIHLLTSSGELISPDDASEFGHLPHFVIEASLLEAAGIYAPVSQGRHLDQTQELMDFASVEDTFVSLSRVVSVREMIEQFNLLQKPLLDRGLAIERFLMNASGDLALGLNSGTRVELGRHRLDERFARFITVYDQALAEQFGTVKTIDLRYSNGASVQWRGEKASG